MKRLRLPLLALVSAVIIFGGARVGGVVINHTASLPPGFYRKQSCPVRRGCLVLFRLPEAQAGGRSYAQENLIKKVVAMEGDRVTISATGVTVNGQRLPNSTPLTADHEGRPLPVAISDDYSLLPGELLTMSTYNARSFDSRYFGPVPRRCVVAVVTPVLTWGPTPPLASSSQDSDAQDARFSR